MAELTPETRREDKPGSQTLLDAQRCVLEAIVRNDSLSTTLAALCRIVEQQSCRALRAAIHVVEVDGGHSTSAAVSNISAAHRRAGMPTDLSSKVAVEEPKGILLDMAVKASWSLPIVAASGALLGTFGIHMAEAGEPLVADRQLIEALAPMAALAIERQRSDEALAAELHDTRLLRDLAQRLIADEPATFCDDILSAAIAISHADAGTIQLLDERSQALTFLATRGFGDQIISHFARVDAASGSPCGRALASGERTFMTFDANEPDTDGSNRWHLEAGMICAQSTPLISRLGKPVGMFSTHWRSNHTLTERELRYLDLLGRQIADLIERQRSQASLRVREEQLRLATDAAEIGLWDLDVTTNTLFWPPRVKAMFGISAAAPISMTSFYEGLHPADCANISEAFAAAIDPQRRAIYDVEYRTVGKDDGNVRWVAAKGRAIFEGDRCVRVIGTAIDISARKLVEQRLRRSEQWLAGQKEAFQAAINGAPLECSLQILVQTALEQLEGQGRCAFYIADAALKTLHHVTGMPEGYARCVEGFKIGADSFSCGLAAHRGKPILTSDVKEEPLWRSWEWVAEQYGFRACWSFPVETATGKVVGSLAMYFDEPRQPTADDHALAAALTQAGGLIISRHLETEERTRIRDALKHNEELLRAIFDGTYEYIGLLSADGILLEANRASLEFGPSRREDVVGRPFWDTVWFANSAGAKERLRASIARAAAGEFVRYEAELTRPSGEAVVFDFSLHPIRDDTGNVILIVPEGRDISALARARRDIEAADRQKDEFLAMLAHELRNPLAPIRNAAEILARTLPTDGAAQSSVRMIKRQVTQLTKLVDDLLDVSRITQGRIMLDLQSVDLALVVSQAVETLGPLLQERRHRLSVTSQGLEPLHVHGDFARLVQCVGNLLSNAAKYTDPEGDISVRTYSQGDDAVIVVADNGAGVSSELLPRIFDLFVQSDRTLDRAQGGLGVGLAVVRRLVEMHTGKVTAHSDGPGRGSCFQIRLPRVAPTAPTEIQANEVKRDSQRILIVDDNADAADSLAVLLRFQGHVTQAAYSASEALAAIEDFRPDIAFVDIGLPQTDGYELARRIHAMPGLENLKLVALTGYGQADDRRRAMAAGFAGHLVKPVDVPALDRALDVSIN